MYGKLETYMSKEGSQVLDISWIAFDGLQQVNVISSLFQVGDHHKGVLKFSWVIASSGCVSDHILHGIR